MKSQKRSIAASKETRKIRKILNEEVRLGLNANSDSETEEVDLKKEMHPLGYYINDREEMIDQMFSIIKGPKLKKMLPPILKDVPVDELKADCLIHLLGMSKKRILAVLDGREIYSSSDSETQSDDSSTHKRNVKSKFTPIIIKQEGCSDISDNSEEVVLVDPDREEITSSKKRSKHEVKSSKKQKKKKLNEKSKKTKLENTITLRPESTEKVVSPARSISDNEPEEPSEEPKEGKTLLEILELEMRARAIRALLQKGDNVPGDENSSAGPSVMSDKNKDKEASPDNNTAASQKITPTKNFRKQTKDKSDDIIILSPKFETIDLTEENELSNAKKVINAAQQGEELDNLLNLVENNQTADQQENVEEANTEVVEEGIEEVESVEVVESGNKTIDEEPVEIVEKPKSAENSTEIIKNHSENSQNTEIISIPDSPERPQSENLVDDTSDVQRGSWAQRWLESDKVKEVVKTSKICGNIRKRIIRSKLAKKVEPEKLEEQENSNPPPQEIEGRVDEYMSLTASQGLLAGGHSKGGDVENKEDGPESINTPVTSTEVQQEIQVEQVQDVSSTKVDTSTDKTNLIPEASNPEVPGKSISVYVNGPQYYENTNNVVSSANSLETSNVNGSQNVNEHNSPTNSNEIHNEKSTSEVVLESRECINVTDQDKILENPNCNVNSKECDSITDNNSVESQNLQENDVVADKLETQNNKGKTALVNHETDQNEPETLEINIDTDDISFE